MCKTDHNENWATSIVFWGFSCAVLSCSVMSNSGWPHGQSPFFRQEYWSGLPCPPPWDLPNPEINPGLPYCRWILYHLSHWASPRMLGWVAYPFSSGSSWLRNQSGSPALQMDSLPVELPGKSNVYTPIPIGFSWFSSAKYTFCLKYIFKIAAFSYENVHSFGYKM